MASWRDRLVPMVLISPEGQDFTPKWIGDPRRIRRRVGVFSRIGKDGTIVKDYSTSSYEYALTLIFDGENNDLDAERFSVAAGQKGLWTIDHPVKGELVLQLLAVEEKIEPVDRGGITRFETRWIEPGSEDSTLSSAEQKSAIEDSVDGINETSMSAFYNGIAQGTATERWAVVSNIHNVLQSAQDRLALLYRPISELNSQISSVRTGILDAVSQTVIDTAGLAGQVQTLVQLPAQVTEDLITRVSAYGGMLTDIYGTLYEETDPILQIRTAQEIKNAALTQELSVASVLGAICLSVSAGSVKTRKDAVSMIDTLSDAFEAALANTEVSQGILSEKIVNEQYFSLLESYADIYTAISGATSYLFSAIYNLAVEKKFTLRYDRAPIEIVISEYGTIDPYLDLFIESNSLSGKQLILLPAGTEVSVYA